MYVENDHSLWHRDVLLGNDQDAANRSVLGSHGISHVINVTSHVPLHFESDGVKYLRFPASDTGFQNLRQYFEEAICFIGKTWTSAGIWWRLGQENSVAALVSSRLDYANAFLYGSPSRCLTRLLYHLVRHGEIRLSFAVSFNTCPLHNGVLTENRKNPSIISDFSVESASFITVENQHRML